ncbi:TetR/AcrR family transcriptional regulator [Asticcacaulis sp. W401b]|uniref:TetR/AcrR family transcriptional regulator n=1 Tax=Asticcacaulis sp. W401b TaxID=3388666 RepID=UPI00397101E5
MTTHTGHMSSVRRREHRQQKIIKVATEVFLEHGYRTSSMSEVASRLGGSKATLWQYFPSKDELFVATINDAIDQLQGELSPSLFGTSDTHSTLLRFCLNVSRVMLQPRRLALFRLVQAEAERFPTLAARYDAACLQNNLLPLSGYLRAEMDRCKLRYIDPMIAARTLLALAIDIPQRHYLLHPDKFEGEKDERCASEDAVDTFLRIFGP